MNLKMHFHEPIRVRETPRLSGLLSAIWHGLRQFDLPSLATALYVETAQGKYLDLHGKFYGLPRLDDETDTNYRARILLKLQSGQGGTTLLTLQEEISNVTARNVVIEEALQRKWTVGQNSEDLRRLDTLAGRPDAFLDGEEFNVANGRVACFDDFERLNTEQWMLDFHADPTDSSVSVADYATQALLPQHSSFAAGGLVVQIEGAYDAELELKLAGLLLKYQKAFSGFVFLWEDSPESPDARRLYCHDTYRYIRAKSSELKKIPGGYLRNHADLPLVMRK